MKFRIEVWSISQIIEQHSEKNLILTPPYQRKYIWALDDQQTLIGSINRNYPVPNIFLFERPDKKFDIVDGQQRVRTMIGFYNQDIEDEDGEKYNATDFPNFEKYKVAVIIIEEIEEGDISIEKFYGLINSAGIHLNRPEVNKAQHYDTEFLKLIERCNENKDFKSLGLFTELVLKRMNDIDFVSELIILLKDGITDKKEKVDKTFDSDISKEVSQDLENKFSIICETLSHLNAIYPIKKTRYKQRNDFYTLFGFLHTNASLSLEDKSYIYKTLVLIGNDIFPSNEECIPFQNYARNCVTQSNSKAARGERLTFLNELFLNETNVANQTQNDITDYYSAEKNDLVQLNKYWTLNMELLKVIKPSIVFNN